MATYDCIIIGAGPAGLTAAAAASAGGKRVLVLDKASRPGTKLLLAGGGKANVTNRSAACADYVGEDPEFAACALARRPPEAILGELRAAGIVLEERGYGRMFCKGSARAVLDLLAARLPDNCRIQTESAVQRITRQGAMFSVVCPAAAHSAPCLALATGSPAWPQCGADGSGLRLARALGHRIVPPRPVLAPFVAPPAWPLTELSGMSLPVRIRCDAPESPAFEDELLFTHKGLSGPAALQISCWWRKGLALVIDFLPDGNMAALLDAATGKATPRSLLSRRLPDRLIARLLDPALAARRTAELSRAQRRLLADAVHRHRLVPLRSEGMGKAEAAAGGVDTREVDPRSMESRIVPGLFFCGEILDITGRLGGYNLHWAWASGLIAGESLSFHG
jgi:predicted Rossmann fold flavoprotein